MRGSGPDHPAGWWRVLLSDKWWPLTLRISYLCLGISMGIVIVELLR
jgi:hypothetical protein